LWATALLVANNLRDIPGDTAAGKRTLAVRIGDAATRRAYTAMIVGSYLVAVGSSFGGRAAAAALVGAPLAVAPIRDVRRGARGPDLIGVLAATGRLALVSGLAMALGLAVTG
jgi:1,4-dihydroxy-2-naphthoate octaprenyltransferase